MGDPRTHTPALEGEGLAPGLPGKSSQCGFHCAFIVVIAGQIVIFNFFSLENS